MKVINIAQLQQQITYSEIYYDDVSGLPQLLLRGALP